MPGLHQEPLDEVISEHERLVRVLRSPDRADDRREADRQAQELAAMKRQRTRQGWPIPRPAPQDRPAVEIGDELYFHHPQTGPRSGKVIAHGAHGVTLQCATGQRYPVRWNQLLGAKQRLTQDFEIVERGEDGAVVADDRGRRRFLRWPKAEEEPMEPPLKKAQPTPAQIEAGNYRKQHIRFQGLNISIENPKGSVRQGIGPHGKPWRTTMRHSYGYIRGSKGIDKDHVDCYVGPHENADYAYIVHQRKAGQWDRFDEDKVMLGFKTQAEARCAYLAHYDDPRFLGPITSMPMEEFKIKVLATAHRPKMIKGRVLFFKAQVKGHARRLPNGKITLVKPYQRQDSSVRSPVLPDEPQTRYARTSRPPQAAMTVAEVQHVVLESAPFTYAACSRQAAPVNFSASVRASSQVPDT